MTIAFYPPATDTTLGLLNRFCLGVPTSRGEFLIPCPSEEFARGALSVLQSLPPSVWETLAPAGEPPIPVAATPAGVESTESLQTAPSAPEPICEAPRPQSVISTAPVEIRRGKAHDKLPHDAPATWEEFKLLPDAEAESRIVGWLRRGWTEGGLSRLYGLSAGAVTSRRQQIRARLIRNRELDAPLPVAATDRPLEATETPKSTPSAPANTAQALGEMLDAELPPPERTPGTALYELGRRGMAFIPACKALSLEPSKALHLEWKEGQYDRACEER